MALQQRSLLLYGLEITPQNSSIDFQLASGGPVKLATLNIGYYSLSSLLIEIARAMSAADNSVIYTVTADRTISGGMQNRVTIAINGSYLKLLFGTGPRLASSISPLIGFNAADYSGSLSYTGSSSAGIPLVTTFAGYNYQPPELDQQVQGARSVSASGVKEAIVFQLMPFATVEFKYEPKAKCLSEWAPFFQWAVQQRGFDFTPEFDVPGTFYNVTLDKTPRDANGLAYQMKEMLPQFPNNYMTGALTLRVSVTNPTFSF